MIDAATVEFKDHLLVVSFYKSGPINDIKCEPFAYELDDVDVTYKHLKEKFGREYINEVIDDAIYYLD